MIYQSPIFHSDLKLSESNPIHPIFLRTPLFGIGCSFRWTSVVVFNVRRNGLYTTCLSHTDLFLHSSPQSPVDHRVQPDLLQTSCESGPSAPEDASDASCEDQGRIQTGFVPSDESPGGFHPVMGVLLKSSMYLGKL